MSSTPSADLQPHCRWQSTSRSTDNGVDDRDDASNRRGRASRALLPLILPPRSAPAASRAAPADVSGGWGNWWLPPDHSTHGAGIDSLFIWIFWITMVTFVARRGRAGLSS